MGVPITVLVRWQHFFFDYIYILVVTILAVILITAWYYVRSLMNEVPTIIPPSPYVNAQSTVIDVKTGVRISTRSYDTMPKCPLKNAYDVFLYGLEKSRNRTCLGKRRTLKDAVKWLTYNEWVIMEFACAAYSFILVPVYDTLGENGTKHIINETELKVIFCDTATQAEDIWKLSNSSIKCLIIRQRDAKFNEVKSKLDNKVAILSYDDLLVLGQQNTIEPKLPSKEDIFIIMYTSGSTGLPKGVIITHENFTKMAYLPFLHLKDLPLGKEQFSHISYLPLAHAMEQTSLTGTLLLGGRTGFLTSTIKNLAEDFQIYKPHNFIAVPRIFQRIYSETLNRMHSNFVYRWISTYLLNKRIEEQKRGIYYRNGILDRFFFGEIREYFGGRIISLISGGAPLTENVSWFIRAVFACPLVEGYGSTESGGVSNTLVGDRNCNHVGSIIPGCRVKLIDVPEMDIKVERDKMGEICVLSDTITSGYFKRPDLTKDLIDKDGYLRTGDIGTWLPNGALKLVDRVKNIFKLSQGEYVAPEKVENIFILCEIVSQVFVEGNSQRPFCVAIIKPQFNILSQQMPKLFEEKQWDLTKPDANQAAIKNEICHDPKVCQFVLESITKVGKSNGLMGFEIAKAVYLTPEPFTVQNGLLTATFKLARQNLRKRYSEEIAKLYKQYE